MQEQYPYSFALVSFYGTLFMYFFKMPKFCFETNLKFGLKDFLHSLYTSLEKCLRAHFNM